MEIRGKITKILPLETGVSKAGNDWKKQEVILTQFDKYSSIVCVTAFGDSALKALNGFNVGDTVDVSVNIKSRESGGKYYTSINAWSWSNKNAEIHGSDFKTSDDDDDMPF